jgi:hypothetical protein
VEKLVEWRLAGETEVLRENLPQRHFVHLGHPQALVSLAGAWRYVPVIPILDTQWR